MTYTRQPPGITGETDTVNIGVLHEADVKTVS
jgi:hypothetical protein